MSQLKDNLASIEINLLADELSRIAEATKPKSIYSKWMVERMNSKEKNNLTDIDEAAA